MLHNICDITIWIVKSNYDNTNSVDIDVRDAKEAAYQIPKLLSENKSPIIKYEKRDPSLEEIFIEAVNGK